MFQSSNDLYPRATSDAFFTLTIRGGVFLIVVLVEEEEEAEEEEEEAGGGPACDVVLTVGAKVNLGVELVSLRQAISVITGCNIVRIYIS